MRVEMAADSSAMCVASCVRLYTAYYCGSYSRQSSCGCLARESQHYVRAGRIQAGPRLPKMASASDGFRFYVEMPMPRLLELQQMAERRHAGQRQMVQEHWQQVRWRYSQEELGESPLPVLQRLLGGATDGANAWI